MAGYRAAKPKWEAIEKELKAAGKTPETEEWDERSRTWFYRHGGTLDAEGNCIYNKRHSENPLPIKEIREAIEDVKAGRFRPPKGEPERGTKATR